MSKFSDNLRLIRKRKKMTQSDLAKILDVSTSTIGMYEQGRRQPSFEQLEEIADALNVYMSDLINEEKNQPPTGASGEEASELVEEIIQLLVALPEDAQKEALQHIRYLAARDKL